MVSRISSIDSITDPCIKIAQLTYKNRRFTCDDRPLKKRNSPPPPKRDVPRERKAPGTWQGPNGVKNVNLS